MTKRTKADIDKYREAKGIVVEGKNIPSPVETFEEAGFCNEIMKEISNCKYVEPMPIQSQAWPVALQGRDLHGIAETGSGKTLAFLLPGI